MMAASIPRCAGSPQVRKQFAPTPRRPVARGNHADRCRPGDREIGIVEGDAEVLGGIMRAVDAVTHVGGVQRLESVQESRWDVEVGELLVVETEGLVMTERGGVRSDVDHHVVDGSVSAADQFGLTAAGTPVHAADHSNLRPRLRVLYESRCSAGSAEVLVEDLGVEGAGEQPAVVSVWFGCQDEYVGQFGGVDSHEVIVA